MLYNIRKFIEKRIDVENYKTTDNINTLKNELIYISNNNKELITKAMALNYIEYIELIGVEL